MTENITNTLRRLSQRVMSALARATISLVDDNGKVQLLQLQVSALQSIDRVPRFAEYGMTSNPPANSEAIVVFVGGDRSNGVVIATGNAQYRVTGLATGEVCVHDDTGQKVYLSQSGMRLDGGGKQITLTNTPRVRAETVLLECTGDIVDNCDTTGRSMVADRQIYDAHNHNFVAASGSANLTTNVPNQPE